jgi:4-hydroxy-tetrahydrodipicolinate synthase
VIVLFGTYSVAMVTPFQSGGELDGAALESMVEYLIAAGVPGLLISGSTGEQHSMSVEERIRLYDRVGRMAADRVKIFAGVAAVTTADAIRLARAAERAGVAGMMLGLPPYIRASDPELVEYVTDVTSAVALPTLLYNNPPRTGTDIGVDAIVTLFDAGRIAALKQVGTLAVGAEIIRRTGGRLKLYVGNDAGFLDALAHGYTGITSIIGNVVPREMAELVRLATSGDLEGAQALHERISALGWALFAVPTPVGVKYALRQRGQAGGYCRKPLGLLSAEQAAAIDSALAQM